MRLISNINQWPFSEIFIGWWWPVASSLIQRPLAWYLEFKWRATTKSRTKKTGAEINIGMEIGFGLRQKMHEVPRGLKHIEYWLIGFGELYIFGLQRPVETRLERHAVSKWDLQIENGLNGWPMEIQVLFGNLGCQRHGPRPPLQHLCQTYLLYDIPDGTLFQCSWALGQGENNTAN